MRQESVSILTATTAGRASRRQRRKFWIARQPRWVAEKIALRQSLPITLKRLDFIHTAAWLRVDRFPELPGIATERNDVRWVLFVSNFNGGWEAYLDSFLDAFGRGVRGLWGRTRGFPAFPGPGTRYDLQWWMAKRLVESQAYYCAYPGATTHDVRAALRVGREVRSFVAEVHAGASPARGAALTGLARRLQHCLGETVPVDRPWPELGPIGTNGSTMVVSLAPIRPGDEVPLARRLCRLDHREPSPFRRIPGVHFARLAIIDRTRAGLHLREQIVLQNSWLLFAADFDAHLSLDDVRAPQPPMTEWHRFVTAIDAEPWLATIWDHCEGRDRALTLEAYLTPTLVDRWVQFRDYPADTLADVLASLQVQDQLRRQVVEDAVATDGDVERLVTATDAAYADRRPP